MQGMGGMPQGAMRGMGGMQSRPMGMGVQADGGVRKKVLKPQNVFAAVPFTAVAGQNGRVIPLPFVPRLSVQYNRASSSGLVRGILDSARPGFHLQADTTAAQVANGAVMDTATKGFLQLNNSAASLIAYNYAEARKFHKTLVVAKAAGIALNVDLSSLGAVGEVRAKIISTTGSWFVWHRSLSAGQNILLNGVGAPPFTSGAILSVSGTTLTIAAGAPAGDYVVHSFAHDDSPTGLIQCGIFSNSEAFPVNLGWRPQFIEVKYLSSSPIGWAMRDTARGIDQVLFEGNTAAESNDTSIALTSSGFTHGNTGTDSYIYRAIREA